MTEEEFQELKGLTTEVQLKAMTFGQACHRFDTCDESSKEACKSYMVDKDVPPKTLEIMRLKQGELLLNLSNDFL